MKNESATLAIDGKSDWRITCPSRQEPGLEWAVSELRRYLGHISGCELAVSGEGGGGAETGAKQGRAIIVALRKDLGGADRELLPAPAAGHDGYAVCVTADRIVVGADNGRGAVYGVYDLLERIGCRWFYPTQDPEDPEVVPRADRVEIACGKWAVASPFRYRVCNGSAWFFEIDAEAAKKQLDWAMKARYNAMGWQADWKTSLLDQYRGLAAGGVTEALRKRAMMLHGPAHSFNLLLPSRDYFESHPEWFGMQNGKRVPQPGPGLSLVECLQKFGGASQFCWSNAEARKVFLERVEEFVKSCPELGVLCTFGFDGGRACTCPECAQSTPSDLTIQMMNELAERLELRAPQLAVETLGGYNPVHDPPERLKPHPRLRIVWAHWGRDHSMGYDDDRYGWKDNLKAWREFVDSRLTLCQYYTDNFASPWIAAPYAIALVGDRKYMQEHGVDGWYMLMWPKGFWWNHGLNGYLGGICSYDGSLDPYEAIRDYALHYFGEEAGPRLGAYYEQWARELRVCYRVRGGSEEVDRAMLAAQRKSWIDPAAAVVKADPVLSRRVGKVEKLHAFAERVTEAQRRREEIQKLRTRGEFGQAAQLLGPARAYVEGIIAYLLSLADLEQGLVDRGEVEGFMGQRIKGWIEEEAKALQERATEEAGETPKEPDSMEMLPPEVTGE